jgi:hypothetical protein
LTSNDEGIFTCKISLFLKKSKKNNKKREANVGVNDSRKWKRLLRYISDFWNVCYILSFKEEYINYNETKQKNKISITKPKETYNCLEECAD